METEWRNRITGTCQPNPEILPFLGLWSSARDNSAWPGTKQDLERPDSDSEPSETLYQSLRSLADTLRPLLGKNLQRWQKMVPMDPTITADLALRDYETDLIQALPHIETLSHNPRGHLTIEEIREEVGRARRVSHRAVATLAAHSEDWQTRTFLGVRPRRILAESRQDQWDIYENRAVATLRKRILGVLNPRLQKLNQILRALDEASEHSAAMRGTRFRARRLYELWGEAFESHPSRDRLAKLIADLETARTKLLALADTFLLRQIPNFSAVESPLHSTNVFQSDEHYRQVFNLWHKWERVASVRPPTPDERASKRRRACEDWDLFVLLLTIRACRQLGLAPAGTAAQMITSGARIALERHWTLQIQSDRSILLEWNATPCLQIVGLYTNWAAHSEKHAASAFNELLQAQEHRHPVLIVSVDDSSALPPDWSSGVLKTFHRLRSASLLADNLGLAEASPLKIDSTELVARAIRWVTAEEEWPKLPISKSVPGWAEAWPELTRQEGFSERGQEILFSRPPSEFLVEDAKVRVSREKEQLQHTVVARENLKIEERHAKGDRRALADINIRKKELSAREAQVEKTCNISLLICDCLVDVRERFLQIECCPCCRSSLVERQEGANIMTCLDCGSEWGRRPCPRCHTDYAFIVPHDSDADIPPEHFDPVRIFGADMCASLLPPTTAPFHTRSTRCPRCSNEPQLALSGQKSAYERRQPAKKPAPA